MNPSPPLAVDALAFRRALSQFAAGVTVVTTRDASGAPLGLTVTAFCSVSLDPPLVLVCIDRRSESQAGFQQGAFAVSLLAEDQEEVSQRFAVSGPAKFERGTYVIGRSGLPLVADALAHLQCRVTETIPGGDHVVYIGRVEELSVREGRPLVYHGRGYRRLREDPGP